jgi:chlorite dismutase
MFLGMTMRSQYLIGHAHENDHALQSHIRPGAGKYLAVYPFMKTPECYQRPSEDPQQILHEQIKAAQEFTHVRVNTVYSFGLDDNEFVIALESDRLEDFMDVAMRLREVENSTYMMQDTPRLTAVRKSAQMLQRIG